MRRIGACLAVCLLAGLVVADEPPEPTPSLTSASKLTNAESVRRKLGLYANYPAVPAIGTVKVAILDSGFDRYDGKRPYLPKKTEIVEHYDPEFIKAHKLGDPAFQKSFVPGEAHGRLMAQLVWAASGGSQFGPHFYLLNSNGPTLFRRAVRYAIEKKVDIIIFSGTFEGAGNFDGRGPINAAVDEATAAGIIWINAAGNSGNMVYNGPVSVDPDGYLKLRTGSDATALRFANHLDENAITVTLTWNDYRETEDAGTEKDLDLVVEDWLGKAIGEGKLKQVAPDRIAGIGESKNPRERVVLAEVPANLAGQEYRIRVKAKSANFGPLDRVRILVSATRTAAITDPDTGKIVVPVEFLDAMPRCEIYPPADHAGVLAVGDSTLQSAMGPTMDGRLKPDVVIGDSVARFSSGDESIGSSNAAAYFAGVVAVLRATEPSLTTGNIRDWVRGLDRKKTPTSERIPTALELPDPIPDAATITPNQQRALRYAAIALEEKKRRGEANPEIVVSSPGGTQVVRPGELAKDRTVVPAANFKVITPAAESPKRESLAHTPWVTPTPRELATLVRTGK